VFTNLKYKCKEHLSGKSEAILEAHVETKPYLESLMGFFSLNFLVLNLDALKNNNLQISCSQNANNFRIQLCSFCFPNLLDAFH